MIDAVLASSFIARASLRADNGQKRVGWLARGIALTAGAAATLGHSPFYAVPLFVIAIVALVRLLDAAARRPRRIIAAFDLAWWFGVGHFASGLHWLSVAFSHDFGAWAIVLGAGAVLALSALLACFWGAGCALAMMLWTRDWRRAPLLATALTLSELLRGSAFTGFPWLLPGYVWSAGEPISQVASLVGIYGLSALTLLFAASISVLLDAKTTLSRRLTPLALVLGVFALTWSWGAYRLAEAPHSNSNRPVVRVADSGLSQHEKWRPDAEQEWRVLNRLVQASGSNNAADIVIWPEGAIPVVNFYALENRRFIEALGAQMGDRTLVAGLTRRVARSGDNLHYNSAVVIANAEGAPRIGAVYDKYRLVPFGEYIPFWRLFSTLNIAPLQRIGVGFEPGAHPPVRLVVAGASDATVLICYEAIFPGLVPRGEERPGWIISLTNDAWFGGGAGPLQHFAIARYRAIETGLPMARAASGGVSAIVDAHGRVVASNRGGNFAQATLPLALPETLYSRLGLIPIAVLLLLIALLRLVPARPPFAAVALDDGERPR